MRAFKHADSLKRHELKEVFSDVYGGEEPLNLVSGFSRPFPAAASCDDRQSSDTSAPCAYLQREQREELTRLLKKYGSAWEPWKVELKKFKDNGQSLIGRTEAE
jgi:2-oxoisovalerate dehydrogenase E1 component alpha subunit